MVKAASLSGSRGVIRADDPDAARAAADRVRAIAGDAEAPLLVERYLPGQEVAVEGAAATAASYGCWRCSTSPTRSRAPTSRRRST